MFQLLQYYGKWQGFRERMSRLPGWARFLVGLAGLPGVILALLSLLALLVSILALLVLTLPAYRFVSMLAVRRTEARAPAANVTVSEGVSIETPVDTVFDPQTPTESSVSPPARRQIDVRIVDQPE